MSYELKQDEFQRFLMENINHEFNFLSFCINFSLVICRNKKHLHISGGLIACSTVLNVKAPSTISDVELISARDQSLPQILSNKSSRNA